VDIALIQLNDAPTRKRKAHAALDSDSEDTEQLKPKRSKAGNLKRLSKSTPHGGAASRVSQPGRSKAARQRIDSDDLDQGVKQAVGKPTKPKPKPAGTRASKQPLESDTSLSEPEVAPSIPEAERAPSIPAAERVPSIPAAGSAPSILAASRE